MTRRDKISRSDAFLEGAGEVNAHDLRREKVHRLAEHARFGLDAADTPADDAESIDHGRVRVGADKSVRIINGALRCFALRTPLARYSRLT